MNINIQSIQFKTDSKLIDLITKKVSKLSHYYDRIIDAEIFLSFENQNSQVKDKTVQIKLNLPGTSLIVKETSKKFEEAFDLALGSLKKQIGRHKEKIRN